jgi:flagellar biosynthesis/type III secretory pathway M-ring protein FliF/YscJ
MGEENDNRPLEGKPKTFWEKLSISERIAAAVVIIFIILFGIMIAVMLGH